MAPEDETKPPADAGPVERPVRPVAWLAPETGQVYRDGDVTVPESWAIALVDVATLDATVAAERERWEARVNELKYAVRQLAALNAWHHFGECRAWGTGPIISPHEADELARRVLGA